MAINTRVSDNYQVSIEQVQASPSSGIAVPVIPVTSPSEVTTNRGLYQTKDGAIYSVGSTGNATGFSQNSSTLTAKRTNGIVLQDFPLGMSSLVSNTPGAGGTITAGSGGKGIKITSNGVLAQHQIQFNTTPFRIDSDNVYYIVFKLTDRYSANRMDVTFTLQSAPFASSLTVATNYLQAYMSPFGDGVLAAYWFTGADVIAGTQVGTGVVSGTTVDMVKIVHRLSGDAVSEIIGMYVNPMVAPMYSIIFDDGYRSVYTRAFQYMQRYGIPGTVGVIGSNIGQVTNLTIPMMQEMYAAGWDFVNHTYSHISVNQGYGVSNFANTGTIDQIAAAQTVTAGNNWTLNGTIGSGAFDQPRHLIATSVANDNFLRIQITGIDLNFLPKVEQTVAKFDTGYVVGQTLWRQITEIKAIDSMAGAIKFGVSLSYTEMYNDIKRNQDFLRSVGMLRGLDIYIAPYGEINPTLQKVLADLGITKMRTITAFTDQPFLVPHPLSISSGGGGSISNGGSASLIAHMDLVKNTWSSSTCFLHEIVDDTNASPNSTQAREADFRLVIDNAAAKKNGNTVNYVNFSDWCNKAGY